MCRLEVWTNRLESGFVWALRGSWNGAQPRSFRWDQNLWSRRALKWLVATNSHVWCSTILNIHSWIFTLDDYPAWLVVWGISASIAGEVSATASSAAASARVGTPGCPFGRTRDLAESAGDLCVGHLHAVLWHGGPGREMMKTQTWPAFAGLGASNFHATPN